MKAVHFTDIYFEFDSYNVRPDDVPILRDLAAWLSANQAAKLTVEGHCDERGSVEYNLALGQKRAEAAMYGFVVAYILGAVALSARAACVQVAIPAAVPGCLARHRRLRLGDPGALRAYCCRNIRTRWIPTLSPPSSGKLRSLFPASDQGRQAASAGCRSLIVGGWLGCITGV